MVSIFKILSFEIKIISLTIKEKATKVKTESKEIQTQKGSNERLFTVTRTHTFCGKFFGEVPLIKPQNDT